MMAVWRSINETGSQNQSYQQQGILALHLTIKENQAYWGELNPAV